MSTQSPPQGFRRCGIDGCHRWTTAPGSCWTCTGPDCLYRHPGEDWTPPIPEPAPELCAFPGCGAVSGYYRHRQCYGDNGCNRTTLGCHDFVAPQAKPVSAGALQNVGSIGPAGELIPAKPVLREPKPFPVAGEVWAYAGHEIGEVSKVVNEKIYGDMLYFSNDHPPLFWNDGNAWTRVRPAKPAAKDIPSRLTAAVRALDRKIDTNETGPSAVAAAPGIEPWRPTVDDDFWIPNASERWRR